MYCGVKTSRYSTPTGIPILAKCVSRFLAVASPVSISKLSSK
jgi:hypothetical protein